MDKQSSNIWATSLLDRYYARPYTDEFQKMSLASFASNYNILYKKPSCRKNNNSNEEDQIFELDNNLGFIRKRRIPAIIRYLRYHREKDSEKHFINLFRLYLPHRNPTYPFIKPEMYESFYENGKIYNVSVSTWISQQRSEFEHNYDIAIEAWNEIQENGISNEDIWTQVAPNVEEERCANLQNSATEGINESENEDEIIPDLENIGKSKTNVNISVSVENVSTNISREKILPILQSLNEEQMKLFYFVRRWCLDKIQGNKPDPFHIFLTGGAGTGKSHVIKAVHYECNKILSSLCENPEQQTILLLAYTGTAAFNINGQTIHSAFKIQKTTNKYDDLGEKAVTKLRAKYENLQLLIIDEISMVDKNMLNFVSCRLDQIKRCRSNESSFGNICVLAVGDFYQIPPVFGKMLYVNNESDIVNYWSKFKLHELYEIMRQKEDKEMAELLNRLRIKKKSEEISDSDRKKLLSRVTDKSDYPNDALHIFSLNKEVNEYNLSRLQSLKVKPKTIEAMDTFRKVSGKEISKKSTYNKRESVLQSELQVCVGARIMLIINLSVEDGLVNGAVGTISHISESLNEHKQPKYIGIKFDNPSIGHNYEQKCKPRTSELVQGSVYLEPYREVIVRNNSEIVRHQYPLKLAWACTIHKTQGMTMKKAVISLETIFREGMGYVALSRVTAISGLFLRDFDEKKIYAPPGLEVAMKSMERLHITNKVCPLLNTDKFVILFQNIQSFNAHKNDFLSNIQMKKPKIIGLVETWFESVNPSVVVENYEWVVKPRMRGGVAFLIHKSLKYRQVKIPQYESDILCLEIQDPCVSVCVVYKRPLITSESLNKDLSNVICHLPDGHVVIGGDFNRNIMDNNQVLYRSLLESNFKQIICESTTSGGTLLDHIYVKECPLDTESGIVSTYYSYHDAVYYAF